MAKHNVHACYSNITPSYNFIFRNKQCKIEAFNILVNTAVATHKVNIFGLFSEVVVGVEWDKIKPRSEVLSNRGCPHGWERWLKMLLWPSVYDRRWWKCFGWPCGNEKGDERYFYTHVIRLDEKVVSGHMVSKGGPTFLCGHKSCQEGNNKIFCGNTRRKGGQEMFHCPVSVGTSEL